MSNTRTVAAGKATRHWRPAGADADGLEVSNVLAGLAQAMSSATGGLLIVSPYFVPRSEGTRSLVKGAGRGVRIAVLTNSLAATDVAAVHTGCARQCCTAPRRDPAARTADRLPALSVAPASGAGIMRAPHCRKDTA